MIDVRGEIVSKPVILTGLRANSEFHIGNYLGAILPMVELQKAHADEYQVNMFIPDLHSFTTPIDHGKLFEQTLTNLRLFAAVGLDINDPYTFIYRQSYISAHSELMWILSCFARFGELRRMTQFKEKSAAINQDLEIDKNEVLEVPADDYIDVQEEATNAGLFNYPVLMAADILLYGAKYVPVGEDQRQHVELTRNLAQRINNKFNRDIFTIPETWDEQLKFTGRNKGIRIRSLRNPTKKMSKSIGDPAGTIMLSDDPEAAAKKIMGAETDSMGSINLDWAKQPGISNLLQISALMEGKPLAEVKEEWQGKSSYGELKTHVAVQVKEFLSGLRVKLAEVDEDKMVAKLERDEASMREVANATLLKIQKAVGLRPQ